MSRPEISKSIMTGNYLTNYHDWGEGDAVLLIHGSGPGVSAWANWRLVLPELSKDRRVIAPDMVGFGYTDRPEGIKYDMATWVKQTIDLMDALNIDKADIVGNSFGGALALAMALDHPDRMGKVILMGAMGVNFELTEGLDFAWGYEPSVANMKKLLSLFVDNKTIVNDDLAEMRYEASIEPGFQESFSSMFPAPRQEWVDFMARSDEEISKIQHDTLVIHGRDDEVIPLENSFKLIKLIRNAQLHVFGRCGHWTQIEQNAKFNDLVRRFLAE